MALVSKLKRGIHTHFCSSVRPFILPLLLDPAASNSPLTSVGMKECLIQQEHEVKESSFYHWRCCKLEKVPLIQKESYFNLHLHMAWQFLWRADKLAISHSALDLACHDSQDASACLQLSCWKKTM